MILLFVSAVFWWTRDFTRSSPAARDTVEIKITMVAETALGPLAPNLEGAMLIALTLLAGTVIAVRWRDRWIARAVGYLSILLWFAVGFGMASLHFT